MGKCTKFYDIINYELCISLSLSAALLVLSSDSGVGCGGPSAEGDLHLGDE